jgi:hypothetical protein
LASTLDRMADRCTDNERHGLSFGFSDGLGRWTIVATLVEEFVCLCLDAHKHIYVL